MGMVMMMVVVGTSRVAAMRMRVPMAVVQRVCVTRIAGVGDVLRNHRGLGRRRMEVEAEWQQAAACASPHPPDGNQHQDKRVNHKLCPKPTKRIG